MDMLRTDRTYATRDNAVKALGRACAKLGLAATAISGIPNGVRYVVAVDAAGRFAPVVVHIGPRVAAVIGGSTAFVHVGVTVVG